MNITIGPLPMGTFLNMQWMEKWKLYFTRSQEMLKMSGGLSIWDAFMPWQK